MILILTADSNSSIGRNIPLGNFLFIVNSISYAYYLIIVKPMAESGKNTIKIGYDRDFLPLGATLDDLQRFGKFYTSGKGLISLLKENVTNALIGDSELLQLPPNPFASIMAPPIPVPNTGFINFYQQ